MHRKIYRLIEKKLGDKIDADIIESIDTKKRIDVPTYVDNLYTNEFQDFSESQLENQFFSNSENDLDYSSLGDVDDILDDDSIGLGLSAISLNPGLDVATDNDEVFLRQLEIQTPDEIVHHSCWNIARQRLVDLFNSRQDETNIILKIFRRLLDFTASPKSVCEAFTSLSEAVGSLIENVNKNANTVEAEELYEIQESKIYRRSSSSRSINTPVEENRFLLILKAMMLLVKTQNSMPGAWIRFNERKLNEIIFSFIHLLDRSANEKRLLSALDILSIVDPKAVWCRHWCHSALGRTLLCQALRRNRRILNVIVETVVNNQPLIKEEGSLMGIRISSLQNAKLCHCTTVLTYVVQCRAGRALFPLQTTSRKRPWTARDIVSAILDFVVSKKESRTISYQLHLADLEMVLCNVEEEIVTARGARHKRKNCRSRYKSP